MREMSLMLKDYRLTTAEITYHLPDHPHVLQTFIWQQYDVAPRFPELHKFLDFWSHNLDGPLHSVTVCAEKLIRYADWRHAAISMTLH